MCSARSCSDTGISEPIGLRPRISRTMVVIRSGEAARKMKTSSPTRNSALVSRRIVVISEFSVMNSADTVRKPIIVSPSKMRSTRIVASVALLVTRSRRLKT